MPDSRERLQKSFGLGLRALDVVRRDQHWERLAQAHLLEQVFDLHPPASARNGQRILGRKPANELDRARQGRKSVADQVPVGARLPIDQFIAATVVYGPPVTVIEALHNTAVVKSEVFAVVFLLADFPAFVGRHLLSESQNQGLAVHQHAVEVENDGS